MRTEPVSFYSDGLRLDGDLHLPDEAPPAGGYPTAIVCSGFQGLKDIHPARFGRALTPHGYAVLGFDYRGFGRSDGPRGRLVPQEQVRDVRDSISFLESRDDIDMTKIALVGWALGGGVVVAAAAEDPRVRAVAAVNAIGDGRRSTRAMHDERSWDELLAEIEVDRASRAGTGSSALVHPFKVVRLDAVTRGYVDDELYKVAGFGSPVTLEAAERLLEFDPGRVVDQISPRPLLLIHGDRNELHRPDESIALHEAAGEPKRLVLLEGQGHTEWMFDEHPTFQRVRDEVVRFLDAALERTAVATS